MGKEDEDDKTKPSQLRAAAAAAVATSPPSGPAGGMTSNATTAASGKTNTKKFRRHAGRALFPVFVSATTRRVFYTGRATSFKDFLPSSFEELMQAETTATTTGATTAAMNEALSQKLDAIVARIEKLDTLSADTKTTTTTTISALPPNTTISEAKLEATQPTSTRKTEERAPQSEMPANMNRRQRNAWRRKQQQNQQQQQETPNSEETIAATPKAEAAASTPKTKETTPSTASSEVHIRPVENAAHNTNFTGTRVTRYKHDMKLYENVCIVHKDGKYINFRQYTKHADPKRAQKRSREQNVQVYRAAFMMDEPVPHPLEQWYIDTANHTVFEGETIWTLELYHNPGHCLSDMMFPMVLDRYHRSTDDISVVKEKVPFYDYYLRSRPRKFWDKPYKNWCNTMMEASGLILNDRLVPMEESPKCFKRLLVPHVTGFRFPTNKVEDPEHLDAFKRIVTDPQFLHPRNFEVDYPRDALIQLRTNVAKYFNLTVEPWPENNNIQKEDGTVVDILLHIRDSTQRRQVLNAAAFKKALEQQLLVNVTILSEAWKKKSAVEQLEVYNSYEYIITPHGAHLSNALVARAGTTFLELYCSMKDDALPDPLLTERNTTTPYEKWYSFSSLGGWFATPYRRLGFEYFEAGQTKCTNEQKHYTKDKYKRGHDMYVDLDSTVSLVKTRFGLKSRT